MNYNMDYLIASFVFLTVILLHCILQNKIVRTNNRFFLLLLAITILDIFLDIVSTFLLMSETPSYLSLTKFILTVFYLLQGIMPYFLYLYTRTLYNPSAKIKDQFLNIWVVPPLIMEFLILMNHWTGFFFYFENGVYIRNNFYHYMYYYAFVYFFLIAVDSFVYFAKLKQKKFLSIWIYLIIGGGCTALQSIYNDLLLTGFGMSLGVTVLFLLNHNPSEYTDSLTGALDGQYFMEWTQLQIDRGKTFYFIAVDLHHMKRINAIFGVQTGNSILIQTAKKLQEIAHTHRVFRVSGKRFVIAVNTLSQYEKLCNKIYNLFSKEFDTEKERIRVSSVICGLIDRTPFKTSEEILSYLEYLYSLAPASEDSFLIQGDEKTLRGFQYEKDIEQFLYTAVEEDLFEVFYQPVYSMEQKSFITLEALSRLYHPSLGPISPEIFISLAEKNGLIAKIGQLQLKKICRFVKNNKDMLCGILNVKINLSPAELLKEGHSSLLVDIIRQYDLPFSFFQFEITETVATEYCDNMYRAVEDFTKAGIGLCLDDFGSGYANLNTVLKLPFSAVKLDRSLLNGILDNEKVRSFYCNIAHVLHQMDFKVIAEGVEHKEELDLLSEWGVDMIQGYYFSKPVSSRDILKLLAAVRT